MSNYTAEDIEVLTGLEPVRKRPGMYTDTTRPNHLAQEVIDNSVDEALAGHASQIDVILHRNGAVDGCVYKSLLPSALFMISVQLRRNLLGRIFFHGIEVVREQDGGGDRNTNADALDQWSEKDLVTFARLFSRFSDWMTQAKANAGKP